MTDAVKLAAFVLVALSTACALVKSTPSRLGRSWTESGKDNKRQVGSGGP
jgi:hypothetical protein